MRFITDQLQGLRINICSDPQLSHSSALIKANTGSHLEPEAFAGLAHLTEHMLFAGGRGFPAEQRLMPWVQQHAGLVNATTRQNLTAFYFQVPAQQLAAGVARLVDMLAEPVFSDDALNREIRIIDAEYQLMKQDIFTLISSVLQSTAEFPAVFKNFQVGSEPIFAQQCQQLAAKLTDFHARGYPANNLELWIAGPQSVDELRQIVARFSVRMPVARFLPLRASAVRIDAPPWQGAMYSETLSALSISFLVQKTEPAGQSLYPVLALLLTDAAPASLTAMLSETLKNAIQVRSDILYSDNQQLWFYVLIDGVTPAEAGTVNAIVNAWLQQVAALTEVSLKHYYQLTQQRVAALPLMEQLKDCALGLQLPGADLLCQLWRALCDQLCRQSPSVLVVSPQVQAPETDCKGFRVRLQTARLRPPAPLAQSFLPLFRFFPQPEPTVYSSLCRDLTPVPFLTLPVAGQSYGLLIRPSAGMAISAACRRRLQHWLAPVLSVARHYGGEGQFFCSKGTDYLYLSASGYALMSDLIDRLADAWRSEDSEDDRLPVSGLPIRHMLAELPYLVAGNLPATSWVGALTGCTGPRQQALLQQINRIPLHWAPVRRLQQKTLTSRVYRQPPDVGSRLIVFLPFYAENSLQRQSYIRLARFYEPAFYRRLREEQAVGYVVSCRYQRLADLDGIQIVLQSADYSCHQLAALCDDFFAQITEQVAEYIPSVATEHRVMAEHHQAGREFLVQQLESSLRPEDKPYSGVVDPLSLHGKLQADVAERRGVWFQTE